MQHILVPKDELPLRFNLFDKVPSLRIVKTAIGYLGHNCFFFSFVVISFKVLGRSREKRSDTLMYMSVGGGEVYENKLS